MRKYPSFSHPQAFLRERFLRACMTSALNNAFDAETLSLVILRSNNSEILLAHENNRCQLPTVTIPKGERLAKAVTETVWLKWHLKTICLFERDNHPRVPEETERRHLVLEPRDPHWRRPDELVWIPRENLTSSLQSAEELNALQET